MAPTPPPKNPPPIIRHHQDNFTGEFEAQPAPRRWQEASRVCEARRSSAGQEMRATDDVQKQAEQQQELAQCPVAQQTWLGGEQYSGLESSPPCWGAQPNKGDEQLLLSD